MRQAHGTGEARKTAHLVLSKLGPSRFVLLFRNHYAVPSAEGSPEHLPRYTSQAQLLSFPAGFSPSPWAQFVSLEAICARLSCAAPQCLFVSSLWQMLAFSKVTAEWAATFLWSLLSTPTP